MSSGRDTLRVLVVSGQTGPWRTGLVEAIRADRDTTLVAHVDPAEAALSVRHERPDIVSLDMAGLDTNGQAAALVRAMLAAGPLPILLLVPPDQRRDASMAALVAGAVELMPSPPRWDLPAGSELCRRLQALGHLSLQRRERLQARTRRLAPRRVEATTPRNPADGVVGLAASTGGPPALARVLSGLDGLHRPVIVVQHLQSGFADGFLSWMRRESALPVELATDGAILKPGQVLVVPPGLHGIVRRHRLALRDEPVTLHRPSADVLFHSMAEQCGGSGIGVILTGMGDDGAAGLLALRRAGGTTIAQDEASSAVYGMPKAANDIGAAQHVLTLAEISQVVLRAAGVPVAA